MGVDSSLKKRFSLLGVVGLCLRGRLDRKIDLLVLCHDYSAIYVGARILEFVVICFLKVN